MIKLSLNTAYGKRVNAMGVSCRGYSLSDIYKTWSNAKTKAFNRCMALCQADSGISFRVGNVSSFAFTATWLYKKDGMWYRRVETKDNSYVIAQIFD